MAARRASFRKLPPTALHLLLRAYSWQQELPAPSSLHSLPIAGQRSRPVGGAAGQRIHQRKERARSKFFPPYAGGHFLGCEREAANRRLFLLNWRRAPLLILSLPPTWPAAKYRDQGHQDHLRRQCPQG